MIPGVVCSAIASHTFCASSAPTPRSIRKSRAALAPSTSNRSCEPR
ncbi:Uncharacterised protein [Mycobacteroides abscessus subsp. abscessus]|nr:Uncharacterised protein [Mycobacteroides abscessus subsp. abscessus]